MKKNIFKNLNFIFAVCLFSLISVFILQGNFTALFCSNPNSVFVARADTIETSVSGIDNLNFTYSFDNNETTEKTILCDYTGSDHTLSINATATNVSQFEYNWYYSKTETNFVKLEDTLFTINIKNVDDSGYYYCLLTNAEDITQTAKTSVIKVSIEPKEIVIDSLSPVNKVFDGTKNIELQATYSGVVKNDEVFLSVLGETNSPNVDENKLVVYKKTILSGKSASNYKVSSIIPTDYMFVDIQKLPVKLVWETTENKTSFVYNGKNQISNISPYYISHTGEKVRPNFTITGYNTTFLSLNYVGEFINTGTYEAVITLTQNESNYDLTDSDGNLKQVLFITRATPIIEINNKTFIYNGEKQDARRCVTLNNNEQTLTFLNNTFVTVNEGNGLEVTVTAEQSLNYFSLTETFKIEVLKANAEIDVQGVKKEYIYTGKEQVVSSGAIINNNEQKLMYVDNKFITVEQGNNLIVTVCAASTDNYNFVQKTFKINVLKADIDTSTWFWYYPSEYVYTGTLQSVFLIGYDSNIVQPYYTDASFIDAGTYTAKVNLVLVNDNYNPVKYESLIWKINKASVLKPTVTNTISTYSGEEQVLNIPTSTFYTVANNTKTNAGSYEISISLKNNVNMQWQDGTTDNVYVSWTIEKAVVEIPNIETSYEYTGKTQTLKIDDNEIYIVLNKTGEEAGEYVTYLVLKDSSNYKWQETTEAVYRFNWKITDKEETAVPIIALILASFVVVLIAIYATFHSTVVIKRHRRRKAIIKTDSLEKAKGISLTVVDEVKPVKKTKRIAKKVKVTKEQKKADKEQKKFVKAEKKQTKKTAKEQ